jgi:calcineurin-like phosphoesterase family protein
MNTWFTSDTHFFHLNIIRYCNRPYSNTHDMNKALVANWNSAVQSEDTIFHLGDVAMGNRGYLDIIKELNGYKVLIKGNHDRSTNIMKEYFQDAYSELIQVWDGKSVLLKHRPEYDKLVTNYQIAGHVHSHWKRKGRIVNVGVDVWNFKPVSIEQVSEEFKKIDGGFPDE